MSERYKDEWAERFRQRYNLTPEQITPEVRAIVCNTTAFKVYAAKRAYDNLFHAALAPLARAWRHGWSEAREE